MRSLIFILVAIALFVLAGCGDSSITSPDLDHGSATVAPAAASPTDFAAVARAQIVDDPILDSADGSGARRAHEREVEQRSLSDIMRMFSDPDDGDKPTDK